MAQKWNKSQRFFPSPPPPFHTPPPLSSFSWPYLFYLPLLNSPSFLPLLFISRLFPHSSFLIDYILSRYFDLTLLSPACSRFSSFLPSERLWGIGDCWTYLHKKKQSDTAGSKKKKIFSACNWKQDHCKPNESFSAFRFLKLILLSYRLKGSTLSMPSHNWTWYRGKPFRK